MTAEHDLLPLPELPVALSIFVFSSLGPLKRNAVQAELYKMLRAYARACVEHHTAVLRAEVGRSERYAEQSERERLWAEARAERLAEALRWYAEQAQLCRKFGSVGDAARHALSADGGKRANDALAQENRND